MASDFPTTNDTFREIENLPSRIYDVDDKRTLYAEDIQAITSAIIAIEVEVQSMLERIEALES